MKDCAIEKKLDKEILAAVLGVLLDDREKERLVSQVRGPEGEDSQSGWGQIFTVAEDVGEGTRGGVKVAHWE